MSENISKNSIFKKNISNDNNDKGKNVIKDDVGKHDVLIYLLQQIYLRIF